MTQALIIDDDTNNLWVLRQLLARSGLQTIEISDPTELISRLSTLADVAVVFLDLKLPRMDGYEVKQRLRERYPTTPIIAYSVHFTEFNRAKQQGFDGFLGKPVDIQRFPDQLARILKGEPLWDHLSSHM